MAKAKGSVLVKSVESLIAEKQAIALKERELIGDLNAVLNKIRYQVVPLDAGVLGGRGRRRGGPPVRGRGRKPGRPPKAAARRRGRTPEGGSK